MDDRARNKALEVWGDPRTRAAYAELSEMSALPPGTDADPAGIVAARNGVRGAGPSTTGSGPSTTRCHANHISFSLVPPAEPRHHRRLGRVSEHRPGAASQPHARRLARRAPGVACSWPAQHVEVTATNGQITTLAMQSSLGWGGQLATFYSPILTSTPAQADNGNTGELPQPIDRPRTGRNPWASWQIEITVVNEAPAP